MTKVVIQNNLGRVDQCQASTCDLDDFVTNLKKNRHICVLVDHKKDFQNFQSFYEKFARTARVRDAS